ncbi:MAG: hypothetical protein Q4F80_02665 [bacterium]|nr:hypothetical protein [bacterium]
MKTILNFFFGQKNEYIGLSGFKTTENKKPEIKKEQKNQIEKTALTGLLKRVG